MIRLVSAILAVGLLGATAPRDPAAPPSDRLTALVGTWSCRDSYGSTRSFTFRDDDGGVVAEEKGQSGKVVAHDRFKRDGSGGWLVERDNGSAKFTGQAPSWTGATWAADGRIADTGSRSAGYANQIRYEWLDANTFRRTSGPPGGAATTGEVCARGDTPPTAAVCTLPDAPPMTLHAVMPEAPPQAAMDMRPNGTVHVLVSLDADSHVVGVAIQSSPSALLNSVALEAARRSTYRTGYHDCKPVPSKYIFSVDYTTH